MSLQTLTAPAIRLACLAALAIIATACSDPGPAERAGEQLDESIEAMGDRLEEARRDLGDAIDPPGPGERAGRAIDDLAGQAEESAEELRKAVED